MDPGLHFFFYIILCAWVFFLQICLSIVCMSSAIGGQKRASDLSGTGVTDSCEGPCGGWESNPDWSS